MKRKLLKDMSMVWQCALKIFSEHMQKLLAVSSKGLIKYVDNSKSIPMLLNLKVLWMLGKLLS